MATVQTALLEKPAAFKATSRPSAVLHAVVRPDYVAPTSVHDAIAYLQAAHNPLLMAGGLDVVGRMRNGLTRPELLVSLKNLTELQNISPAEAAITVGATVKITQIATDAAIKTAFPALTAAAESVGYPQIRNMGTLAGNLCQEPRCWYYRRSPDTGNYFDCRRKNPNGVCYARKSLNQYHALDPYTPCAAVCPSDLAMVLAALGARIVTQHSEGLRNMPLTSLYDVLGTCLRKDELLTHVDIPATFAGCPQAYLKFRIRKATDFAIVSAAVALKYSDGRITDAKVVLGGVANRPWRAVEAESILINQDQLSEPLAKQAGVAAVKGLTPLTRNKYKLTIAQTLVRRALLQSMEQSPYTPPNRR